jgi:hypothetical protein
VFAGAKGVARIQQDGVGVGGIRHRKWGGSDGKLGNGMKGFGKLPAGAGGFRVGKVPGTDLEGVGHAKPSLHLPQDLGEGSHLLIQVIGVIDHHNHPGTWLVGVSGQWLKDRGKAGQFVCQGLQRVRGTLYRYLKTHLVSSE